LAREVCARLIRFPLFSATITVGVLPASLVTSGTG